MTMDHKEITDSVINLLGANADDRFTVFGYRKQGIRSESNEGINRSVQVTCIKGERDEKNSGNKSPHKYDITILLKIYGSEKSKLDLTVLLNPDATAQQIIAALAAKQSAEYLADQSVEAAFEAIYNIIMDKRNYELGVTGYRSTDRAINKWEKTNPLEYGANVLVCLNVYLNFTVEQKVTGYIPVAAQEPIYRIENQIHGHDGEDYDPAEPVVQTGEE